MTLLGVLPESDSRFIKIDLLTRSPFEFVEAVFDGGAISPVGFEED